MKKIKIGIPKGFLYYKYHKIWEVFFKMLNCEIIVSHDTNKSTVTKGSKLAIDESCLSFKIYMGHVNSLVGKVDYIFVPRIANFNKKEQTCIRFFALNDIIRNTYKDIKLLEYNQDYEIMNREFWAYLKLGLKLNKNFFKVIYAYIVAKIKNKKYLKELEVTQQVVVKESKNIKILLVSHPYNMYDKMIGGPIVKYLEHLNVDIIYSDRINEKQALKASKKLSYSLYWKYNKSLVGAIELYKDKVDGIILLTTFPCGPDSLVNDLCMRKIKNVPIIYILMDELQGEAGLHTRIESFIDIIIEKQKQRGVKNAK